MDRYIRVLVINCLLLVAMAVTASGQRKPYQEFDYFKSAYPNEAAVFISKKHHVDYTVRGDEIITTIKVYQELIHLGESTARYASDQVYTSSFSQISDLKAYTLIPGKKKYERVDVTEFKESFGQESYVFFDDSKDIKFTYPAVQQGAKTVIEYTRTIKDPRMMSLFFFDSYAPIHEAIYSISYDKKINLKPQFFNGIESELNIEKGNVSEQIKSITFTASERPRIRFDRDSPSFNYLAGSVYCPVSHFTTDSGALKNIISSPEELHSWYRTFIQDLMKRDEHIKSLVDEIVDPNDDILDKVEKIYYWVQSNIKYIAFEDGMRGLIPHGGDYVIEKRYGDCKDMASAIVSMLREAGIDAQYTWIGSRALPYSYSETPSPITDNHMIATFRYNEKIYFLDATGSYTPLELPTSMIQGKECLISYDENEFEIKTVPVVPKEASMITDTVRIQLSNNTVIGQGRATLTGYEKVANTYHLIKTNQKGVDQHVENLLIKGSNKFHIQEYQLSNVEELNLPIHIDYKFDIPDYYREIGDNIYINLILDKTHTDDLLEDRSVPLENEYKFTHRSIVELTIPENYKVKTIPKDNQDSNGNFGYSIKYWREGNSLFASKEIYLDFLLMQPTAFESWNEIITDYSKASRKAIILTKNHGN